MISVVILPGRNPGDVIGKVDGGKIALINGRHNANAGEAFFAEVIREEKNYLVVRLGEKIEPPVLKEEEDIVSQNGDYVIIRCETRRNIRNTFGAGMGEFAPGVNLSVCPYIYGNRECTEPLAYRRHGAQHEYFALRSTGAAADRRRAQEAAAAAKAAEAEAAEKAAAEKAAAFEEWLHSHPCALYWKGVAELRAKFYFSPEKLEEEYNNFVKGAEKEFVGLFKESPDTEKLGMFLNTRGDLEYVPVPAEGGFWAWRKAARIWTMNQIKEF
jgi:hypothetical protein